MSNEYVLRQRTDIYRATKRRGIAMCCNGGIFDEISKNRVAKIKYPALLQNLTKLG